MFSISSSATSFSVASKLRALKLAIVGCTALGAVIAFQPVLIAAADEPSSLPTDALPPETQPPGEFPEPEPLIPSEAEATTAETANYSDGEISIDYPVTWTIEVNEDGEIAIASVATQPMEQVETQVFRVASPPGPLVDANIDSFIAEGSAVSRYSSVTIDQQSALVMWLADRPDALSSAIATFIGYGDETIMLFSRYDPDNTAAEDSILSLHSSFSNLSYQSESASPVVEPEAQPTETP